MSFGTPTNTGLGGSPAAPAVSSFSFGAPKPATAAPPPAFGAAVAQPTLGATAQPTLGFGAAAAAPAMTFGQAAAATAAPTSAALPAFGTTATLPAFGAQAATTALPAFGATQAQTALPAFGAPAGGTAVTATVAPTFSFGTPAAAAAPTTAPPAFGFGTAPATGVSSGLGGGLGGFALNKPLGGAPTTTTTTGASLNFNTSTTTATVQPFNSGLRLGGGTSTAPAATGGIFGKPLSTFAQPAAAAPTTFVGLGGIDVSSTQPKLGDSKQSGVKIKETQVPDEIVKTLDSLKAFIKQQKTVSSDIGRTSASKFSNVGHEIMKIMGVLQTMSNSVEANNQQIKLLRVETSKAIQSLEMAQRTHDTPAALQLDHRAPFEYFQCLVAKYEQELISFRQQITLTERHMQALANPQNISPEDLKRGLRQLNESFISLAGRLHELHQRVEEQKEQYLNLRRYRLRDPTNVFEKIDNPPVKLVKPQRISSGPTPFCNISAISSLNKSSVVAAAATSANTATGK